MNVGKNDMSRKLMDKSANKTSHTSVPPVNEVDDSGVQGCVGSTGVHVNVQFTRLRVK